jgi:hypothetical protein
MAAPLSRTLSNADRCVISGIRHPQVAVRTEQTSITPFSFTDAPAIPVSAAISCSVRPLLQPLPPRERVVFHESTFSARSRTAPRSWFHLSHPLLCHVRTWGVPRRHPVHNCSGENRSPRPRYSLPSKGTYIDSTAGSPVGMFAHHSLRAFAPVEMIRLEDAVCNCAVTCKCCSLLAPAYHQPWFQRCAPVCACTCRTKNQCRLPPLP